MNTNNYPNLKAWKKGQSGNPAGRKTGSKNVSTIVRKLLEQGAEDGALSSTNLNAIDTLPTKKTFQNLKSLFGEPPPFELERYLIRGTGVVRPTPSRNSDWTHSSSYRN